MLTALLVLSLASPPPPAPPQAPVHPVDFQREVRPLLSDRCFKCHGPDAAARKAGLRLDTREGATADREGGAAVVPGDPARSELIRRVRHRDPGERMPPAESGLSLSPAEIALLDRWIEEGARYASHWSLVAPRRPALPPVSDPAWCKDPIDRFVLARLDDAGLAPTEAAEPAVLLRRASFVLTGLPPSLAELDAFLTDGRADAYERQVDRLLASPRFGERMASVWLDLARYADTYGYQADRECRVWPYRDWVIRSYNDNLPFDEFLTWQLAGDLLPDATREQRLATTFDRLHRQTNEGGSVDEEFRVEYVADRVHTFGTAFLGLTLECARCHDHKYDPVRQAEYYRLCAYFDDIDECGLYSHFTDATPTPAMMLPDAEQEGALRAAEAAVADAEAGLRTALEGAGDLPGFRAWLQAGAALELPGETGRFDFDEPCEGGYPNRVDPKSKATLEPGPQPAAGRHGAGVLLDGDGGVRFSGVGEHRRSDPFTVALWLRLPARMARAVVLHRSRAWTDAGSQGWQLLIEDGRLTAALVHFRPGDAAAVRTDGELPVGRWLHVAFSYDGSSRAGGMRIFVDGRPAAVGTVRDGLRHAITGGDPGAPTLGQRFRDRGLAGALADEVRFFARAIAPLEVAQLCEPRDRASAPAAELRAVYRAAHDAGLGALREAVREARRRRDEVCDAIPTIMVMQDMAEPRAAHRLVRGSYDARAEVVEPGTPAGIPPARGAARPDRLGLAEWLCDPEHPLTARVASNRLWQVVFGRGLVPTSEDFGSQGAPPSHPELCDYLATELRASGFDRKAMLRRLVLSATFRQASRADPERRRVDPDNRLCSRGPARRLSAEMLRDAALCASGLLVDTIGGPSVKPYQPPGLWEEKSGASYRRDDGEALYRRSLYTFWKRTSPPPAMTLLDAPGREVCAARREPTNTPLQALVLWNDPQLGEAARVLAERILREPAGAPAVRGDEVRLERLYRTLGARRPAPRELTALAALLERQRRAFADDPAGAAAVRAQGEWPVPEDIDPVEHGAWAVLCSTLLCSDAVVMLR